MLILVAFVCDISVIDAFSYTPVAAETADFASLMFVLSALGIFKNDVDHNLLIILQHMLL